MLYVVVNFTLLAVLELRISICGCADLRSTKQNSFLAVCRTGRLVRRSFRLLNDNLHECGFYERCNWVLLVTLLYVLVAVLQPRAGFGVESKARCVP